ncbi:galactose mutarotase [Flagellimonas sp. 389]|uniref:aldose epimerase family protein n=1 Tax=Flagellimonas sp. 389 TaxID=2835862 RepID=UPI001BD3265C|nr:aldose epimerase family protein [Flagellimonas sp. 389]MBS9462891.1 galactose mutarotase [Flagellimonas sp. 389]
MMIKLPHVTVMLEQKNFEYGNRYELYMRLITTLKKVRPHRFMVLIFYMTTLIAHSSEGFGSSSISKEDFGTMPDGRKVSLFTFKNKNGLIVKITDYGGTIISIQTPDKLGTVGDIIMGYDTFDELLKKNTSYFGVLVGRYANRIGNAKFNLDDQEYELTANNGVHHLHGGNNESFDKVLWFSEIVEEGNQDKLRLTYHSSESSSAYPGNLNIHVDYSLTDDNELILEYKAWTDKITIINLTNHAYFNLSGLGPSTNTMQNVLSHQVYINADFYTPVDETLIPTGEILSVRNTPMDFLVSKSIGKEIQLVEGGFDHNFVLNKKERNELTLAAKVVEPKSGRTLKVFTTKPGLQFYSGNFLDGQQIDKYEKSIIKHGGFCMESQFFPDSPNKSHFPSPVLRPGEVYHHTTIYQFGIEGK